MAKETVLQNLIWLSGAREIQLEKDHPLSLEAGEGEMLLLAAEKGSGEAGEYALRAGHALLFPERDSSNPLPLRGEGIFLLLSMKGSLLSQLLNEHLERKEIYFPEGFDSCRSAAELLGSTDSPERISEAAYRLLLELYRSLTVYREEGGYPPLVEAAIGTIREDFAYLEGVEELAERLFVTPEHLIRQFTAAVGVSPGRFLKKRRLEYARELLLRPDMTVSLAADLSGFSSSGYFAKVFRKEYGISPSDFAAAHREKAAAKLPETREEQMIYL